MKLPAPESVELLAVAGFDFVVIDNEHGTIDIRTVSTMIATGLGCGIDPFVRVPGVAPGEVQPALDAGARGLFVPQVQDAGDAARAVRATRFPPLGRRGASNSGRAGRWGLQALADYVAAGNSGVELVLQAETADALTSIIDIGQVPGVDAVFIGPADLSVSMGLGPLDPGVAAVIGAAERRCAAHGLSLGTTASDDAGDLIGRGYSFLVLGADTGLLRSAGAAAVARARVRPEHSEDD